MRRALRAGVGAGEFWDLHPAEIRLAIEAATWRLERERDLAVVAGWTGAAVQGWRGRRFPSVSEVLEKLFGVEPRRRAARTPEEIHDLMMRIVRETGGGR